MRIVTKSESGFTFIELVIVVTVIGLLAAIAIPNYIKARAVSQADTCISNLRQLDSAVHQYAFDRGLAGVVPIDLIDIEPWVGRGTGSIPDCPAGGEYSVTDIVTLPNCTLGSSVNPPHELAL